MDKLKKNRMMRLVKCLDVALLTLPLTAAWYARYADRAVQFYFKGDCRGADDSRKRKGGAVICW